MAHSFPKWSVIVLCSWLATAGFFARGGKRDEHLPPPSKPYSNSHFLTVDSVRFHYRTWNDSLKHPRGKIVFVHGFAASTFSWRKNTMPLVDAGFRVVEIDLPSFGYSGRYPGLNQSNSNRARLVWLLLKEIDGEDTSAWNIVGHSMGGGIAEAMAILDPARTHTLTIVDGLVFIKSNNLTNTVSAAGRNPYVKHFMVNMAEKKMVTYKHISRLLKNAYGRPADSAEVMGYLTPLLIEGTVESAFGIWTHSREYVKMDVSALQTTPVLIIWGGKDKWIGKGNGRRLQKAVPQSEMVIIPGAGHIPMETHTEEFNALFVPWLEKQNP